MRRALLLCGGVLLGLVAEGILWNGPNLYADGDSWFSAEFTRIVGLGVIVQGVVAALGAALCLGRALVPLTSPPAQSGTTVSGPAPATVGGGPVLPICGILFLLAAVGLFPQALHRAFRVLYLVVGGALLGAPMYLKPSVWQMRRRLNGAGCGIAMGGLWLSGMGGLVWLGNAMTMEAAQEDVSRVGHLGVLAGAILAVVGSMVAAVGRS